MQCMYQQSLQITKLNKIYMYLWNIFSFSLLLRFIWLIFLNWLCGRSIGFMNSYCRRFFTDHLNGILWFLALGFAFILQLFSCSRFCWGLPWSWFSSTILFVMLYSVTNTSACRGSLWTVIWYNNSFKFSSMGYGITLGRSVVPVHLCNFWNYLVIVALPIIRIFSDWLSTTNTDIHTYRQSLYHCCIEYSN